MISENITLTTSRISFWLLLKVHKAIAGPVISFKMIVFIFLSCHYLNFLYQFCFRMDARRKGKYFFYEVFFEYLWNTVSIYEIRASHLRYSFGLRHTTIRYQDFYVFREGALSRTKLLPNYYLNYWLYCFSTFRKKRRRFLYQPQLFIILQL